VRPQEFLERTLGWAQFCNSPPVRAAIWAMGLIGLYLVSRQWDSYVATFHDFFTWEGAILLAVALMLVKAAHELGHAYTAVAYGCRVHTMGVAFLLMAPLLYTDVTDSWRLTDRRKRFMIDSAGIRVELGIAAIALFAWAFLPDGPLRGLAFMMSAVSLVSSLAINLNPFMRFDGYYLLSEALGVDNLQSRSFAFGRWKMREILFGLGAPAPENLPRRLATILTVYAWAVWVYRLVLFIGIALLVYHYFFKVLGIILFLVEIGVFVARPVASELKVWFDNRAKILSRRRTLTTGVAIAAAVVVCVVPWSTRVEIPAVVESAQVQRLFPVRPAVVSQVHVKHGDVVKSGDPILSLLSPDIEQELDLARTKLSLVRLQHARRTADVEDRASSLVLESSIEGLSSRIDGLEKERGELLIRAPFDGRVVDFDPSLHSGRWVSPRDLVATIAAPGRLVAKGYVAESDMWRLAPGDMGAFIPEAPLRPRVPVRIDQIAASGAGQIEIADVASVFSGRIAVTRDERRRLVPASAHYMVHMSATGSAHTQEMAVRGVVVAAGQPESVFARLWRQTLKVLVQESGV